MHVRYIIAIKKYNLLLSLYLYVGSRYLIAIGKLFVFKFNLNLSKLHKILILIAAG